MMYHRRVGPRWVFAICMTATALIATATPAFAHLDPDPDRVEPGEAVTVAFLVEHGCDGAPTIELTFKVPKGVKGVEPQDKDGWISDVDRRTVTFEGGPLDDATPDTFSIAFTAPRKKTIMRWKVVQACTEGVIRWIDTSPDAENPPAVIGVGKDAPAHEEEEADEGH